MLKQKVIKIVFLCSFTLYLAYFIGCSLSSKSADLVLINGKIVTVDEKHPEVQAVAVKGDKIFAVGSNQEIQNHVSDNTKVLDLEGKLVIPGIIEGHAHFMSFGYSKMKLALAKTKNWDEIIKIVEDAVKEVEPGEWILGRGWHQEKWDKLPKKTVEGFPVHDALSKVSPKNPVFLTHASGHASFANEAAMKLAGVNKSTEDPDGGRVIRDSKGDPTGIFLEIAENLLGNKLSEIKSKRTPEQIAQEKQKAFGLAVNTCLENGITGFHDAGVSFATIDFFKEMLEKNKLGIRLYVMISEKNEQLKQHLSNYKILNLGDHRITVRAIKRLIDGALGARGAWLLEPYSDLTSSYGLNTEPIDAFKETAKIAIENDFQLCTHAIGDRGNRETLDIYEAAYKSYPNKKDLRWRVEHAQHLSLTDIPRFGKLGIIPSMQAIHCTSDGPWVPKRLGDQRTAEGAYVWQKLMKSGAIINNGTDAPVEDIDPIANFYAAVSRKLPDGSKFYPDQCMSREEALKAYTLNCAYAAFEEDIKGSLTPGKLADITVLSKDIMTIPEEEILDTEVLYTIVGGKIMYEK